MLRWGPSVVAAVALGVMAPLVAATSPGGTQQVFIKTLQGKTITLEVGDGDSIGSLKDKIRDVEGIPTDQQTLSYRGQQLPDGALVSSIGLVPTLAGAQEHALRRGSAAVTGRVGPCIVMQTVADARSSRHVRGAFDLGSGRGAALTAIADAGGLSVPRGSTITARATWGGAGVTTTGTALRLRRPGAYRVVVSVAGRSGGERRAPVLVTAGNWSRPRLVRVR